MKHTFTHEQIAAIRNLIIVAEEQYSELRGFCTSADDIILQQSIDEVKKILDDWDDIERPNKKLLKKGWHWVSI
jgi:hypothetical protein